MARNQFACGVGVAGRSFRLPAGCAGNNSPRSSSKAHDDSTGTSAITDNDCTRSKAHHNSAAGGYDRASRADLSVEDVDCL